MPALQKVRWVAGTSVAAWTTLALAVFLVLYVPAAHRVSVALSEIPADLQPLPPSFTRTARCVHAGGVAHFAARRLLLAAGYVRERPVMWTTHYFVWTRAVEWISSDGGLGLFANTMVHKAGSGLELGAKAYFGKSAADLTPAEALELLAADWDPQGVSPELLERWRERCL